MEVTHFDFDVFLSHSAKDKAMVRDFSLSASTWDHDARRAFPIWGTRFVAGLGSHWVGVRCRSFFLAERLRGDGRKVYPTTSFDVPIWNFKLTTA